MPVSFVRLRGSNSTSNRKRPSVKMLIPNADLKNKNNTWYNYSFKHEATNGMMLTVKVYWSLYYPRYEYIQV